MSPDDKTVWEPPRKYGGYEKAYKAWQSRLPSIVQQQREDLEFAEAEGLIVEAGPWGSDDKTVDVAYIGVDPSGRRFKLDQICSRWRYQPSKVVLGGERETFVYVNPPEGGALVVRILIGRQSEGLVIARPRGKVPVQADGIVDGKEFYFRSRGKHWSLSIDDENPVSNPSWFYEEYYGDWPSAGSIPPEQAMDSIEKAVAIYRSGAPTMDRGASH